MAFGSQGLADHRLHGRVSGPLHLESAQVVDEFRDNECRADISARDLLGLLNQVVLELAGPQAVAEQLGDQGTLGVVLMLRDATGLEGLAREVG